MACRPKSDETFQRRANAASDHARDGMDLESWNRFAGRLHYVQADLSPDDFHRLRQEVESLEKYWPLASGWSISRQPRTVPTLYRVDGSSGHDSAA